MKLLAKKGIDAGENYDVVPNAMRRSPVFFSQRPDLSLSSILHDADPAGVDQFPALSMVHFSPSAEVDSISHDLRSNMSDEGICNDAQWTSFADDTYGEEHDPNPFAATPQSTETPDYSMMNYSDPQVNAMYDELGLRGAFDGLPEGMFDGSPGMVSNDPATPTQLTTSPANFVIPSQILISSPLYPTTPLDSPRVELRSPLAVCSQPHQSITYTKSPRDTAFHCNFSNCKSQHGFKRLEHLKRHERTHGAQKLLQCNYCATKFPLQRQDNYRAHVKLHAGNKKRRRTKYFPEARLEVDSWKVRGGRTSRRTETSPKPQTPRPF